MNAHIYILDDALKFGQVSAAAGFPEPLEHEPCRLLGDADLFGELHGGDALARRGQQVHRIDPLVQRDVAALEDGARPHREVLFALVAAVKAASTRRDALAEPAHGAARAIGPKAFFEVDARRLGIGDQREQLEGGYGRFAHLRMCPEMGIGLRFGR